MVNDDAPKTESSAENSQSDVGPKRGITGQIRSEAIVQSANLFLVARRILTTSLGAIALSIEETNEFIERLVERGEVAEHELTAMIDEMSGQIAARGKSLVQRSSIQRSSELGEFATVNRSDDPKEDAQEDPGGDRVCLPITDSAVPPERPPALLGDRVESILGRLNVPTRNDIENLTNKIEVLSGKVLLLRNKSQRSAHPDAPTDEEETVEEIG